MPQRASDPWRGCLSHFLQWWFGRSSEAIVIIPTGEEPDMLLWPMPVKYQDGDEVVAVDSTNLRFHVNFESAEMTKAIQR